MAERGVRLTNGKTAAVLDTLARVQFLLGKKEEAVATQSEAVHAESDPNVKALLEKTLASYGEGKAPEVKK